METGLSWRWMKGIADELLVLVFSFLPPRDVGRNCAIICRRWSALAVDDLLWKSLLTRDFGASALSIGSSQTVVSWKNQYLLAARRETITVAVVGHAGCGKTSVVHQLVNNGKFPVTKVTQSRHEAREINIGRTIDSTRWTLHLPNRRLHIIDLPGHSQYSKTLYRGCAVSDLALLVVSAERARFGIDTVRRGQARDHATAAFIAGVKSVVVAVTGLDAYNGRESMPARFQEVRQETLHILKKVGFVPTKVPVIPVVALGTAPWNISDASPSEAWPELSGVAPELDSLLEVLSEMTVERPETFDTFGGKPLRFVVESVRKLIGPTRELLIGRVVTGAIRRGQQVVVAPIGKLAVVRSLEVDHCQVTMAGTSQCAGVILETADSSDIGRVPTGYVLCHDGELPRVERPSPAMEFLQPVQRRRVKSFVAHMSIMSVIRNIHVGYEPMLRIHTAGVACRIISLEELVDTVTGKTLENKPKTLTPGQEGIVVIKPLKAVWCESPEEFPPLGRFALFDLNIMVGCGTIKTIEWEDASKPMVQEETKKQKRTAIYMLRYMPL